MIIFLLSPDCCSPLFFCAINLGTCCPMRHSLIVYSFRGSFYVQVYRIVNCHVHLCYSKGIMSFRKTLVFCAHFCYSIDSVFIEHHYMLGIYLPVVNTDFLSCLLCVPVL